MAIIKKVEFEMIEDFMEFMDLSSDATYASEDVKNEARSIDPYTLVKIEKQIASPIKILSVVEVTEDLIKRDLGDKNSGIPTNKS